MASSNESHSPQVQHQSSTHMMKTTRSGRPFVKDIHDLFSTLVVSLPMDTHRHLFRTYPNTFTTEEAVLNLGSLKFTQSNRSPDPKDPSRIITTTTTTTFSMTKDMAKSVCQTFMDAKLFEHSSDTTSRIFRDKNLYCLTPKGVHILEKFVVQNGIIANNLTRMFTSQLAPIKLYYLERNPDNDALLLNKSVIDEIFRRFVGPRPNDITPHQKDKDSEKDTVSDAASSSSAEKGDRNLGIELKDRQQNHRVFRQTFYGLPALDWICDFTTAIAREEASKIANEFLRLGLIEPVPDKKIEKDSHHEPRLSRSTLYKITSEGRRVAGWDQVISQPIPINPEKFERNGIRGMLSIAHMNKSDNSRSRNVQLSSSLDSESGSHLHNATIKGHRPRGNSVSERHFEGHSSHHESNTKKLSQILEDLTLRSHFMDFLKANFCEENLLFLLDIQQFKAKHSHNLDENGEPKGEEERQSLIADSFRIYNNFLAPASVNELNIDYGMRHQMIQYMTSIMSHKREIEKLDSEHLSNVPGSSQTQATPITVRLYDEIQDTIFRLMATDSVPKFSKTDIYLTTVFGRPGHENGVTLTKKNSILSSHGKNETKAAARHKKDSSNGSSGSDGTKETPRIITTKPSVATIMTTKPSVATVMTTKTNGIVVNGQAL